MEESEHWKDMFEKLLDISSRKIAELETDKEHAEAKLTEALLKANLPIEKN